MISNEELDRTVAEVLQEDLAGPTTSHRMRTASCPTVPILADVAEHGLDPRLALHVANCGFCCLTIRAMWSALDELGNDWAVAERAAHTAGWGDLVTSDVQRCADRLLSVCERLPEMKIPEDLRRDIADVEEALADSLDVHDSSTADDLRRMAFAMLNTGPVPTAVPSKESFAKRITDFILQLAAKMEGEGDLWYARTLYLSIGERVRAGRCTLRAWAEQKGEGNRDSAIVALATARLELDGDEAELQAEAQLAGLAASAGHVGDALDLLAAAIRGYHALGDDEAAARLQAERDSMGKMPQRGRDRQAPGGGARYSSPQTISAEGTALDDRH